MGRPHITVVGLGPAAEGLTPPSARKLLTTATTAFLRTARHPAADALSDVPGISTFDHHYDAAETFDEVYARIVADLVTMAQVVSTDGGEIVYAVPGSPLVAERTVELLRADPRVDVSIVPAMSFLDLAWMRLGVDPVASSVRLVDGTRFSVEAAGERGPLLVAQCWTQSVLSDVKLAISEVEPATDITVTVLHHLGLPDELLLVVPWHEIDHAVAPDHLTTLWIPRLAAPVAGELAALDELVRRLRRDCPWDRQQTHVSLERHLLEETYEVLEAIDTLDRAMRDGDADGEASATLHLEEELGDLLFQVFIHARLAAEEGRFTVAQVARGLHDKLVSRHPHVFGDVAAHDAGTVVANWEEIKKKEKGRVSVTDGIPAALPSLALAAKLQRKSAAVPGATLQTPEAVRVQLSELIGAFMQAVGSAGPSHPEAGGEATGLPSPEVAARSGALLWAVADLVRRTGIEPEDALRAESGRFADYLRDIERRPGADTNAPASHIDDPD